MGALLTIVSQQEHKNVTRKGSLGGIVDICPNRKCGGVRPADHPDSPHPLVHGTFQRVRAFRRPSSKPSQR